MNRRAGSLIALSFWVALGASAGGSTLEAQQTDVASGYQRPSVENALQLWEEGHRKGRRVVRSIILSAGQHSAATVDSVLSGITLLALTAEDRLLRYAASSTLLTAGSSLTASQPLAGVVSRAREIYKRSDDNVVRLIIVQYMSEQAERREAIASLKEVVEEGDPLSDGFDQSTTHFAIGALHVIGEEGREALRELYESGAITKPAVGYLRYLKVTPRQRP